MEQENQNNDVFVVNGVANYSFVKESVNKVATMSHFLGIFYSMGWHYKQWKEIKKCNEIYKNISPFWRGIFYLFFYSKIKKIILGLYETKMNTLLQNENFPEKEKKQWEKEYKSLKSSFARLQLLQTAINKFLPLGHPKGKTLTCGDFLGFPFFVLLILFLLGLGYVDEVQKSNKYVDNCVDVQGKTITDTCANFSLTFPFDTDFSAEETSDGSTFICQEKEDELLCYTLGQLKDNSSLKEEDINEEGIKNLTTFTKTYSGNTTYCFHGEIEDKNFSYTTKCYMNIENSFVILVLDLLKTDKMDNIEKMLNTYQKI